MTLALIQSDTTEACCKDEPLEEIEEQDTVSDEVMNLQEPPDVIALGDTAGDIAAKKMVKADCNMNRKVIKAPKKTYTKKRD